MKKNQITWEKRMANSQSWVVDGHLRGGPDSLEPGGFDSGGTVLGASPKCLEGAEDREESDERKLTVILPSRISSWALKRLAADTIGLPHYIEDAVDAERGLSRNRRWFPTKPPVSRKATPMPLPGNFNPTRKCWSCAGKRVATI